MLDYDEEAPSYDETRGGERRAEAAAVAMGGLVPPGGRWVDVAGGTGSVAAHLRARGHRVIVLDQSLGMLRLARERGLACACGDATALPFAAGSANVVSTVWLLHLLADAAPIVGQAARVLSRGGTWLTTVDKDRAHGRIRPGAPDARARLDSVAATHGLRPVDTTSFVGHGQGRRGGPDPIFTVVAYTRDG